MSEEKKNNSRFVFQMIVIVVLAGLLMYGIGKTTGKNSSIGTGLGTVSASEVLPTGTPRIYGEELNVRYNDISVNNPELADATIQRLGQIDVSETLQGEQLQRYIKIAGSISCEYCCGAASIIFSDGSPACGCAHSYAMRGLAKYLIKYHGTEFSDEQILEELGKWKVLFFPGIHQQKAAVLKNQGIELNYINLASNKYRGIEKGQTNGNMVGEC